MQESFQEAGRIAAEEGAAAVALHARYAEQLYAPPVHWAGIAALAHALPVPVIGNGDVFTADDALAMLAATGAQGVMIGRACLGRPWVRDHRPASGSHVGPYVASDLLALFPGKRF